MTMINEEALRLARQVTADKPYLDLDSGIERTLVLLALELLRLHAEQNADRQAGQEITATPSTAPSNEGHAAGLAGAAPYVGPERRLGVASRSYWDRHERRAEQAPKPMGATYTGLAGPQTDADVAPPIPSAERDAVNAAIQVNSPFERVPQHAHDPGFGPVPPEPRVVDIRSNIPAAPANPGGESVSRDAVIEECAQLIAYRGQCSVQMINAEERLEEKKAYAWDAMQHAHAIRALKSGQQERSKP